MPLLLMTWPALLFLDKKLAIPIQKLLTSHFSRLGQQRVIELSITFHHDESC